MSFADSVIQGALERQGGRCAGCGKQLVWDNEHRGVLRGAWEAHYRRPGGSDFLRKCVLLCSNPPNCHFNLGHEGNWSNRIVLYDDDLPFLYAGEEWEEGW